MRAISQLVLLAVWVTGMVLAKGFWSTFFAVMTCGVWSLYLILERLMMFYGIAP